MVFFVSSFAQEKTDFEIIDSLHKNALTVKIQDSLKRANAHYRIGEIYRFKFMGDSAYYHYNKAEKLYRKLNNDYKTAITLYGIATVQCNENDLTGSEITSIEAISLLESIKETIDAIKYKSYLYNNLGIVFGELEQFDESILYFNKSIELKKKLPGDTRITIDIAKNNLAFYLKKSGNYELALDYYLEILENKNLINENPEMYALVLDNYAHTLFLSKNLEQLPSLFLKALKITDSVNPRGYNSVIINQHLAQYYYDDNKKNIAKKYAYKAKEISEQYYNDELLSSLLLLSKIEEDSIAAGHLVDYVRLSDSLQKVERATRNKYARIRFETDQIEQENIQIARERMWLFIISIVVIIASLLLYVVINQRNKNKELKFKQQQQEANEEIYNLMLSQNEGIEEARIIEKKRISEELHDGVLGRLFGTRLSLDSLNMNSSDEAIKTRSQYITELKTIEEDIRKVSHELNTDFVSGSGFIDIIKTLVETQTKVYNLDYKLDYQDVINWEGISNKTKIHIYRIVQESLHNIYKHAHATSVDIKFKLENNKICLTLSDNGSGFDVNKAKSGIGLKNMNSRINEIDGSIYITSEKDIGTTVTIKVPTAYDQIYDPKN